MIIIWYKTLEKMDSELFIEDIIIQKQSIRGINYTSEFDEEVNFNDKTRYKYNCQYELLNHKENKRDHILILEFEVSPLHPSKDRKIENKFALVVQGHYEISEKVEDKDIETAKHNGSLALLTGFLRTSICNITSLSSQYVLNLPLINLQHLHKDFIKRAKKPKK